MPPPNLGLTLVALCSFGAALPAQGPRVIPSSLQHQEGNTRSSYPFHFLQSHMQQIWEGQLLTKMPTALILSIGFRRDNTGTMGSYAIQSVTLPKITVSLGYTSKTIQSLSYTFAENETGAQTVIFSGKLVLPHQSISKPVGPWNIIFKAARPFLYQSAQGNLLMDIKNQGTKQGYSGYWIDAAELRSYATYWMRGMSGPMSDKRRYTFSSQSGSKAVPGGTIHLGTQYMSVQPSGIFFIGFSETRWGPLSLPFDLTALGMLTRLAREALQHETEAQPHPQATEQ
jgi:hypothetical protein